MEEPDVARVTALFDRALDLPRAQRAAFLTEVCGGDIGLREELASLLEAHESADEFFDDLAKQVVSPAYGAIDGSPLRDADSTLRPELEAALGSGYRIEQELGGGAMSRVFLAEEVKLLRKVVIKVLPPELTAGVSAERFRREIQLVAQLQHPHIVPLFTSDSTDSLLWYTMPFVAGESLRTRLVREGPLPIRDARKIWHDVLDALAYAHAAGVAHRDIKPANILLGGRNALVTDFGIARALEAAGGDSDTTASGLVIGTPAYMAPEQVMGDVEVDHRTDIYAAALVMHEMLEGRSPFAGRTSRESVVARLTREPSAVSRSDCPHALSDLILRCLARAPSARPATADAVLAELESVPTTAASERGGVRPARADSWRPRLRQIAFFSLAGVAIVAAGLSANSRTPDRDAGLAQATATIPSIAVLPLRSLSSSLEDATLAGGMTEELIATLARGGNVRVVASTSVMALLDRRLNVRQIAESLHVTHVIEGGLQKNGDRLRMEVRLVDTRDGSTRWSETFDKEMRDIFAVQDDIARAVALKMNARLTSGEDRLGPARRRHTPSIAAYELYLQGMKTLGARSIDSRAEGVEYFQRAIAADSSFAGPYAGLVFRLASDGGKAGNHLERQRQARWAGLKAVALDDSLAFAHSALGWAYSMSGDHASAEPEFTKAIALDPRVYRGYEGLARIYIAMHRPAEQLVAARLGLEVEPFSPSAMREMALALNMNGRCDETLELLRPLKELSPPVPVAGVVMGLCYIRRQMWKEAIDEYRSATAAGRSAVALSFLGYSFARAGQRDSALAILSDLRAGRKNSLDAFGIAVVYAGLRDYDQAFAWLAKAREEGAFRVYIYDPAFEDLQRDPRFDRLMGRGAQKR